MNKPMVLVAKDGKVIPGQEKLWNEYVLKEVKKIIKKINLEEINPEFRIDVKNKTPEQWFKDAEKSIHQASYRLGVGEVWI